MSKSRRYKAAAGAVVLSAFAAAGTAIADDFPDDFEALLSGEQEVVVDDAGAVIPGGTGSAASGSVEADFDDGFTALQVDLRIQNLANEFAAAHFHCGRPGENGPVVFGLVNPGNLAFDGSGISGTLTNADYTGADCVEMIGRPVNNLVSLAFAMRDGLIYANVHTDVFPSGEIRGQMLDDDIDDPDDDDQGDDDQGDDDGR